MTELQEFDALAEVEALRKAERELARKLQKAKAKTEDLVDAVYRGAKDAAIILGKPPAVPRAKADRRVGQEEAAVLLCSDWHFGKHTDSFNLEVAKQRIELLGEKVEQMVAIERADHPVRELHMLLGGSMGDS